MKGFSFRAVVIGIIGLFITTTSSMYVALRLGALPWPTVFVTVLAMAVLSRFRNSSLQEINVCHTLMSSGSMVAGGLAFTLPGIWILNPSQEVGFMTVLAVSVSGAVLGTVFSNIFRKNLIEERKLVFPIGNAAYQTLVNGIKKGKQALKLFASMAFSIVFTVFRDVFAFIPSVVTLFKGSASIEPVTMWLSPMAMSIGAVIDATSVLLWAGGMVLGYFILAPIGVSFSVRQSLGIGLMLGTGLGILVKAFLGRIKDKKNSSQFDKKQILIAVAVAFAVCILLAITTEISFAEAVLTSCAAVLAALLSGLLTGQSGINPMEIFGILAALLTALICKTSQNVMFLLAAVTAVACGLSGDVMNDFRSGYLLGTDSKAQLKAEAIGGVVGAVISACAIFVMKKAFGTFGTEVLPAPQARAVATMIGGFGDPVALAVGLGLGCLLTVFWTSAATLGLGLYLSTQISTAICLGAALSKLSKKFHAKDEDVGLVASGFLGGEGITGVVQAIISMF